MASAQESDQPNDFVDTHTTPENFQGLDPESYTAQRLRHASVHHLHLTTRRFFIGPIPEGWIHSHRKNWYRTRLSFKNYTSRTITFSAKPNPFGQVQQGEFSDEDVDEDTRGGDGVPTDDTGGRELSEPRATGTNEIDANSSDHDATPRAEEGLGDNGEAESIEATQISTSFATARESLIDGTTSKTLSSRHYTIKNQRRQGGDLKSPTTQSSQTPTSQILSPVPSSVEAGSTTSLLAHQNPAKSQSTISAPSSKTLRRQEPEPHDGGDEETRSVIRPSGRVLSHLSSRLARFNLDDNVLDKQQRLRSRMVKTQDNISANRPRWSKSQEGEMVRAEKMLVRVEETSQEPPFDYTENESLRMETRLVDKWKEYLVVCRKGTEENIPFTLKMYKTRVIQNVETSRVRKSAYYEIPLNHKKVGVNLYSSLDKTVVLWHPYKQQTRVYIVRSRSAAHAVEWYTFIRQTLGWHRPSSLLINVPDLGISIIFKKPFEQTHLGCGEFEGGQQEGGSREQLAAAAIIRNCMKILQDREWADVLKKWSESTKIGLAWKRYDRLEWVHGVNENQMYGTIAMQTTHDLELRPKHHYQTTVKISKDEKEEEPAPVEGFLVRLTSQKGVQQRMSKAFFKRQYFVTQDRYLCFCKPAKAIPPLPPKVKMADPTIPSYQEIIDDMPLQYEIDPFPEENGQIKWLYSGNKEFIRRHDEEAFAQSQRALHNLTNSEGFIDLCQIREVRRMCDGNHPQAGGQRIESQPQTEDSDAGKRENHDQIFELELNNGLVIRLQAYNTTTRDEWIKHLEKLVKYWKARVVADAAELKVVRQHNLKLLDIDEEMESILGQFASKWEVRRAEASPHLYNMCPLSGCRAIRMSGPLYRKPRRRSTFSRCNVILTAGQLLIFQDSLRKKTGVEIPHIHKELLATLDLRDCYIYSGLLTESDLLYANQTFDSNRPGHHALPRIYLSQDGWTSQDEDTAVCFVIWHATRKSLFRALDVHEGGQTSSMLRQVSSLGVPGRSVVFKARSRVERDRWVLTIESEIDKLQEERGEDIRIVPSS